MSAKKNTYKNYVKELLDLTKHFSEFKVIVIYGPSDYLIQKTLEKITNTWKDKFKSQVTSVDASELKADEFINMWEVSSMFDPKSFGIVRRVEKKPSFSHFLKSIPSVSSINNPICISINQNSIPAKLSKDIKRLEAKVVPCFEPTPYEMKGFIKGLSKKYKLNLDDSAVDLISEVVGENLFDIDNELQKISLIFHDKLNENINRKDLLKYLPVLKTEHIFKLDNYIIAQNKGSALSMLYDLSQRESPLGLLAMIANHCRKSLKIIELLANHTPVPEIASRAKLPPFVVKKYLPYLRRKKASGFSKTLTMCHDADVSLKTTKTSSDVILSSILITLFD